MSSSPGGAPADRRFSHGAYVYAALLVLAVLAVYLPGLNNGLVFDDKILLKKEVISQYGSLLELRQRMLSYGSFVWVEQALGQVLWMQRLVNVLLHLGVVAALFAFFKPLLARTAFPDDMVQQGHFADSQTAALRMAVALFALNPVAVYAVAYLVQRSILMATLFALLAAAAWVRAVVTGRPAWYVLALLAYGIAVLCKEHAVLVLGLAVPLYIHLRRPPWRQLVVWVLVVLAVLAVAVAVLLHFYGAVVGRLFDAQSLAYAQQLDALRPGVGERMYPLSILNQLGLFFAYGLLWVLPYVGWMSIDLRPAFPLGLASSWHIAGALGYLAVAVVAIWLVLRRTGVRSLLGLLLLLPLLWFATEFATVWVQDPFVLYRSYLWATALPGLLALLLTGVRPRTIYVVGTALALLWGALALERVLALKNEATVWADAVAKTDLQAPPNAVGRSRAFLNLAVHEIGRGQYDQAVRHLISAQSFGDRGDLGASIPLNLGIVQQQQGHHGPALQAMENARKLGAKGFVLDYHQGVSLAATGQFDAALAHYQAALDAAAQDPNQQANLPMLRVRRTEAAMAAQKFDLAIADFVHLLKTSPNEPRLQLGLGMAYLGKQQAEKALEVFQALLKAKPSADAYYGRGMAHYLLGQREAALADLDQAIALAPNHPQYRSVRQNLLAPAPAQPGAR